MAGRKMEHLAPETILADIEANLAGGQSSLVSSSEDFFRYGGEGPKVNFERLRALLANMREASGGAFMQIDHANISSVLQLADDELREARRLLSGRRKTDYLWVNMGLESANGRLVQASGPGKLGPFSPDDWEDMVLEAADRMSRTGFYPVFSLILGLPGETPDDVTRTLRLVRQLASGPAVVFPIFYEPVRGGDASFRIAAMTPEHLELYTTCYEMNFRWIPKLYWDNQRAGGVGWLKRAMIQIMGKMEVLSWRRNFARTGRRIAERMRSESPA
jgi:radical SAM superfamily enzyme YgiQ (UPF0313 family)